jgi:hypothetical protein
MNVPFWLCFGLDSLEVKEQSSCLSVCERISYCLSYDNQNTSIYLFVKHWRKRSSAINTFLCLLSMYIFVYVLHFTLKCYFYPFILFHVNIINPISIILSLDLNVFEEKAYSIKCNSTIFVETG